LNQIKTDFGMIVREDQFGERGDAKAFQPSIPILAGPTNKGQTSEPRPIGRSNWKIEARITGLVTPV
jgi:hypothetical protein